VRKWLKLQHILALILCLFLLLGVASGIWLKSELAKARERAQLIEAFVRQYPQDQLVGIEKPAKIYIFYRKASDEIRVSLLLGSHFVEIGSLKPKEQQSREQQ